MTLSISCEDVGDPVCTHTIRAENKQGLWTKAPQHAEEIWKFILFSPILIWIQISHLLC